jgi:hypothetical protein
VSGRLKSSFPHPTGANLALLAHALGGGEPLVDDAIRLAQMLVPALVALAPFDRFLLALAAGALMLAAYDFWFVLPRATKGTFLV